MTYDEETGEVTFEHMTFGQTLSDGMSIDVIVYDGHVPFDYYNEGWYTGQVVYDGCDDYDDHQCRYYYSEQGIADCVGNHANPVWRRFTVDAVPPTMTRDQRARATRWSRSRIDDANCGICELRESGSTVVSDVRRRTYDYIEISNDHSGILRFDGRAGRPRDHGHGLRLRGQLQRHRDHTGRRGCRCDAM